MSSPPTECLDHGRRKEITILLVKPVRFPGLADGHGGAQNLLRGERLLQFEAMDLVVLAYGGGHIGSHQTPVIGGHAGRLERVE
jgi:hypothetical protein